MTVESVCGRFLVLHCVTYSVCLVISAPKFYPLNIYTLFAIKTYGYGQDFCFYHKTKHKAADNTLAMMRQRGRVVKAPDLKSGGPRVPL